ncbi:MAG: hypothetical protein JXA73_04365 [Acidobacteria bacterium]|nr:hypothetical protein [Acidobacteriota bacterium]
MIQDRLAAKVHGELVLALESARMRLSVAIAVETKSTPQDRRRYYLDTTEQVCRFIRRLRKADGTSSAEARGWINALDSLGRIPIQARALRLCQALQEIMKELE